MDKMISNLARHIEGGRLSRRQLIEGLTLLATTAATTAKAAESTAMETLGVDHVSVQVSNMERSIEFYKKTFNLKFVGENAPNKIVRLGTDRTLVSMHPAPGKPGVVDHFCLKIKDFNQDKVTAELKQKGLTPDYNIFQGFYVKDPDGVDVQMI